MADSRRPSRDRHARGSRPSAARSRPATRSTPRPSAEPQPAVRSRYTNRMVVLVLVVAVLAISYASSMRAYLRQRGQIDGLSAQIASSTAHIHRLRTATREWSDPAYVEQQARQRLGWVFPGETAYQTIGPDGKPLAGTGKLSRPVEPSTKPVAWWSKEYASLESADHPARVRSTPQPATKIKPSTSSTQSSGG